MIKNIWLRNVRNENIKTLPFFFCKHFSETTIRGVYPCPDIKDEKNEDVKGSGSRKKTENGTKNKNKIKEELRKNSFLDYNLKTDIYLNLHKLKIYNPTEIQKNVIPLLLDKSNEETKSRYGNIIKEEDQSVYNDIIKNRLAVNHYLKSQWNIQHDFYDIRNYNLMDNENKNVETVGAEEVEEEKESISVPQSSFYVSDESHESRKDLKVPKCFNDAYLIVSPEKSGKTLSYFIPVLHNFYSTNEKRMNYLTKFYQFLNKNNYKRYQNKLLRKKEKLNVLRKKDNLFFDITYDKYRLNNRYVHIRTYRNCNTNTYIKNKRNNALNCLKHKKNVFVPFAIILTNTREAAFELFSFLKNFDVNIELLSGGYKNKIKSIKQNNVEHFVETRSAFSENMGFNEQNQEWSEQGDEEAGQVGQAGLTESRSLIHKDAFFMELKKKMKNRKAAVNHNIDILIGTPDKIFEKVENYKNKHLYNFKFLKYIIIEEADSLCNVFNQTKVQLVLNHIKNYTNMYYYRYYTDDEEATQISGASPSIETERKRGKKENREQTHTPTHTETLLQRQTSRRRSRKALEQTEETNDGSNKSNIEVFSNEKERIENVKNTLDSNIPIMIFVSATKTVAITDFLKSNIRSKYIQQIVNLRSHNTSNYVKHIFINSRNKEKVSLLLELLESEKKNIVPNLAKGAPFLKKYIIFCNTSRSVKNLTHILTELKYSVGSIHSEMNFKDRTTNYRKFRNNEFPILVCTNIFSRGINFENAEIINYDISNNINDYIYKSGKASCSLNNDSINNSAAVTTFFNKKNSGLINDIIDKTTNKKQIVFQNLNKKVSRLLKLYNNYYDVIKKKQRRKKKGGRKAMGVAPRRNCLSKRNKILSKKIYFYHKMNEERKRLIKKGILKPYQKIPRFPNRKAELYDSNEYNSMSKLSDGSLQILAKKRKTKKSKTENEGQYEENTIVLEKMPTYEEEVAVKEKVHQKKTYF